MTRLTAYLLKRIITLLPVLLGVTILVFGIMQLTPGDPVRVLLGEMGQGASEEQLQTVRSNLGLDQPLHQQYWTFLSGVVRGDLGRSFRSNRLVAQELWVRFPYTLVLAITSLAAAVSIGLPVGIVSALKQNTKIDYAITFLALLGVSIPVFWLSLLLMMGLSYYWPVLPASGSGTWRHLVMPAMAIGLSSIAFIARMTRSSMLDVLGEDYIRTARAKGLRSRVVVIRHGLRNAAIPIVTTIGLQFGSLLGGAVLTETIFAWPGIGRLTVQAILARDLPVIQGSILFVAVLFTLINLMVDLLYAVLNPRIRYE